MKNLLKFFVLFYFLNFVDSTQFVGNQDTVVGASRIKRDFEDDYNYACGDEFMETKCKCNNTVLDCNFNNIPNLNIHLLAGNFTVKTAKFSNNKITVLKKRGILPGREYSIQNLDLSNNKISLIENGTFDEFKKLEGIVLAHNNLEIITENVLTESLGKTLVYLNLNRNRLKQITPKTFMFLKKLETLELSHNPDLMPFFNKNVFSTSLANLKYLDISFCNISTLDDEVFVNLVNLEKIILYMNPFTTVPKAVKTLRNLRRLSLSHTQLTTLNKDDFGYNPNLKEVDFVGAVNLTTINDCAFCNFPNLEDIIFWDSPNLTFIHPNAFGSISSGKLYSKMKNFNIERTRISTISERLFDWSKAEKLYLATKGYICDCSMAWLINDLQLEDSIFSSKFKYVIYSKRHALCKNISGIEITGTICDGRLSTLYHPSATTMPSSLFKFYWIFLIGMIFGICILCYFYGQKIAYFVFYRKLSDSDDTNKLFRYRNLENDESV